ncbi:MAG: EAL domain-containing protein [Gammaproteobacteria bacterium]|nr:EAL domain-containing protein [Gammaproteobacteria bacterium]MBU1647283.1 EAL domain-containing protein [Gammaproteobacteria bacterium]MBU1972795.1 EAL domain-containing protein [Gammaproteobacteria bacterium]
MTTAAWQPLIEGMLEAVWIVDPIRLRIIGANRAAETLLGVAPGGLDGRATIDLAATPEDLCFWEDVAAGLSDHILSETLLRRDDATTVPVERRVSRVTLTAGSSVYVVGIRDQTHQRRVETELETLIAELRATLESTADGILVVDMASGIRGYNQRFADMWGLPSDLLTKRDDAAVFGWMAQSVLNVEAYSVRLSAIMRAPLLEASDVIVLRSGRVLERVTLPQYARGRPIGRVYSFRDITRRLADEARLQLAAKVFGASLDAIFVTGPDFRIVSVNPSCERMTGFTADDLLGQVPRTLLFDRFNEQLTQQLETRLQAEGVWEGEIWHRHKDGRSMPCQVAMVRVADDAGNAIHYIGFFKDLSETVAAKQRIEELAYNDVLTGLPNRLLLAERIQFSLSLAQRDGTSFAILFLDLDRFKQINDSLGHMFGDRVLVQVAERIKACLRHADTASRLGGDEFVLLLHNTDARGAEITARRLLDALARPFSLDEMAFTLSCSIGIALFPDDGRTMDDLIKNADSAMYHVKERGRSDFRFYQRQMNVDLLSRMKLDHAMRMALDNDGFRLHFQPQVDLKDGTIFGAEALLRWHDAELGDVSPGQFIPVAEETGLIVRIGHWVLHEAIAQAARWHADGLPLAMAINVSALQFRQSDFTESVARALADSGLPPHMLELELTESILIQDADDVLKRLEALARLGVMLSIDDFGTGYSSLSYLKRFPLHRLKIDRSFITELPHESDAAIVTAIVNLARSLKLRVIAEGVETDLQREFLLAAGCQEFQGFLCSPALPADAFRELVTEIGWTRQRGQYGLFPHG